MIQKKSLVVARCSTNENRQDINRQINDLVREYESHNIVKIFKYYKSGMKNETENHEILQYAIKNKIDNIIVTEVSRISRKISNFSIFLENCNQHRINLIIDNYKLHTLIDQKENSMAQTMLQIAAIMAKTELDLIKERLNSGRDNYIRNGGTLGRKKGTSEKRADFMNKHSDIVKYLKRDQSIRDIMKLTGKSSGTIMKVKKFIVE